MIVGWADFPTFWIAIKVLGEYDGVQAMVAGFTVLKSVCLSGFYRCLMLV